MGNFSRVALEGNLYFLKDNSLDGYYNRPLVGEGDVIHYTLYQQINVPCSSGENVPASMFMYGSTLIDVTSIPQQLSSVPKELAITPLPTPLITPPVTRMYFIAGRGGGTAAAGLLEVSGAVELARTELTPLFSITLTTLLIGANRREANMWPVRSYGTSGCYF